MAKLVTRLAMTRTRLVKARARSLTIISYKNMNHKYISVKLKLGHQHHALVPILIISRL